MVRPRHLDGIVGADTSATRIARRAEPVVLRGTRSASAPSIVGSSIDGVTKDVVGEDGVVRDDSSCQVVRNALADVKNGLDLTVAVLRNNLERSEQLSCQKLSLLLTTEVLQRDINCSWLPCAIFLWDRVVLQRSASEKDLSAVELKNGIDVGLDGFVVPGENRANSKVLEAAFLCLFLHLLHEASLAPIAMHEHDGLCRALLARVRIGILVTSKSDHVNILLTLRNVRAQDFPVIATVLKANFTLKSLNKVLSDFRRASEERILCVSLLKDLLHYGAIGMDEIHILLRQTTVVQHADPLLEDNRDTRVSLDQRLVAHVERSHHLQDRDFDREVERSDHANGAVREPIRCVELTEVVTRLAYGVSEETHSIAAEVLKEVNGD